MTATFTELQNEFQRCILERDDNILDELLDGSKEQRAALFEVYRRGYVSRLVEVLQNNHELLHTYLGDDDFQAMAEAYIAARPSRNPNLRWFSKALPEFLRTAEPYNDHPVLREFVEIENALEDAFDSLDAPVLMLGDLATVPADEWSDLGFVRHDCVIRLDHSTNAFALWNALKEEQTPPDPEEFVTSCHLIVWRHDSMSMIREMSDEEAMMWDEAANDVPFGVLCTMLATFDDPDGAAVRAAGYLRGWIEAGMLSRIHT